MDITSTQTGSGTEGGGGSTGGTTGAGEDGDATPAVVPCGYFAALLRDTGSTALEDVFLSKTPNAFTEGADHRADSLLDSDYLIWNESTDPADDGLFTLVTKDGQAGSVPINVTLNATVLSSGYDYLAYGKWVHTGGNSFTGSGPYSFVDYSWWLEGMATPEAAIAAQTGTIPYAGEAFGTMSYGSTSVQLSGAFAALADFDTAAIESFTLAASDGGIHTATVSGAGGSIHADGTFDLSGGVWTMTNPYVPITTTDKEGHGRFFGPNVEEIGGDWAMKGTDTLGNTFGVVGIYGGRQP